LTRWKALHNSAAPPGAYDTKAEAVSVGRTEAQRRQTEHDVIHREDGSIGELNSYGNHPVHRPG